MSGVVEFSYRGQDTTVASSRVSEHYWTQTYRANLAAPVLDPRFLLLDVGAGYGRTAFSNRPDLATLDYNLNTQFFPGMKVNWSLYGSESTSTVESATNVAGYDVTTTVYGGTFNIDLAALGRRSGNNGNNTSGLSAPVLSLSRNVLESESISATNPLKEQRTDTEARMSFSAFRTLIRLTGSLEEFENLLGGSSYEIKQAELASESRLPGNAKLFLEGRLIDRTTSNLAGFDTSSLGQRYTARLDFRSAQDRWHYYNYIYDRDTSTSRDLLTNEANAQYVLRPGPSLQLKAGLRYRDAAYVRDPDPAIAGDSGADSSVVTAGITPGVSYTRKVGLGFLGPQVFSFSYDPEAGSSRVTDAVAGEEGGGFYYVNSLNLGLATDAWQNESVSLNYSYSNRRDDSPLNLDALVQNYRLTFLSRRVARTVMRGTATYDSRRQSSEAAGSLFFTQPLTQNQAAASSQHLRGKLLDVVVDHFLRDDVTLSAGVIKGRTSTSTFTLSTLTPAETSFSTDDMVLFGSVMYVRPLTRFLVYRLHAREEYRTANSEQARSHRIHMYLDWRIRSIFLSAEYRWWQDVPETSARVTQQYYYAKLSRPF